MKTLFYWIFGTVMGLLLVLVAAVTLLLGTESGLSWALRQTDKFAPKLIVFAELEGHLLDRLHVQKLQLNLPTMRVRVDNLVLDWQPSALFQREFHLALLEVDALILDTVDLRQETPERAQEKPGYPIELPDLELPLTIIIDSVQVKGVEVVNDPNADPVHIENIALQARWDEQGMTIQQFELAIPGLEFSADGRITPGGDYPLEIQTLLRLSHASLPKGLLRGKIAGDKRHIDMTQRFAGDAQIELAAALTQPMQNLTWDGTLTLLEFPGRLISPDLPAEISGQINSRGDLNGTQLDGQVRVISPSNPTIDLKSEFVIAADLKRNSILISKLQVTHQRQPMRVSIAGTASLEDNRFDLKGDWRDLQWPLTGEPDAKSTKGKFSANGTMDDYRFKVSSDLSGKDIPQGQWTLKGSGSDERLKHVEAVGQTLDGVLKTRGQLSWVPVVSYDFTTTAHHINPGAQYPEWQGSIDMGARINGTLSEAGPLAKVALEVLKGELRGLPIRGKGIVNVSPDVIDVDRLVIGSGDSEIRADGKLGVNSRMNWEINVPEASDLIPQASGRLVGQGRLQGPQNQPRIRAQLEAKSLHAQQLTLDQLSVDLDVDLSTQIKSNISLSGQGMKAGTQQINQLSINATGTLDAHEMNTAVSHDLGQVKFALQGGVKGELWKGVLQNLSLQSGAFGNWDLERAAEVTVSANKASAAALCMRRERVRLCAEGQWGKLDERRQRSRGRFEIAAFPLAWLEPWLPADIQTIDGQISAKGNVELGPSTKVHAEVNVTQGTIVFLHPEAGKLSVPHEGVRLVADVNGNGAKGDVTLGLAENKISASFDAPYVLAVEDPLQTKIAAHVALDGPKLDFLTTLVPQLSELKASARLDFDVQGTVGQPRMDGKGKINIERLQAPELGVVLSDSSIDINGRGEALQIEGLLTSTEGRIEIKGNSQLDARSGWPTKLSIKGDNFLAVNLPESRILISPDLVIEKTSQALRLAGEIMMPKADIFIETLPPSARSAHSDVIVIQETTLEEAPQSMPLEMDVTLRLGKEIHFVGLGLNAYFDGELKATAKANEVLSVVGDLRIDQGTYRVYGQELRVERGILSFADGPASIDFAEMPFRNAGINLRATRQIDEIIVGVNAIGPLKKPRLTNFSVPAMSENDIISYLLIGNPARDPTGKGDRLTVSQQINSNLSATVGANLDTGEDEFSTRYQLSRKTYIEAKTTPSTSAAGIFYTWETE